MAKKTISDRKLLWIVVIASFSLAILDMMFLRDVFNKYLHFEPEYASIIAFVLATVANISALMWGRQKGQHKPSLSFFLGWVALGLVYAAIRGIAVYNTVTTSTSVDFNQIMAQLVPILILTISYIGTGTMLKWAGEQLWDIDIINYMKSKKEFTNIHATVSKNNAAIWKLIDTLKEYDKNYITLENQYNTYRGKIRKNEHSIMTHITGKTIANNPAIDPVDANLVMEEVLRQRDIKNEEFHKSHQQTLSSHR